MIFPLSGHFGELPPDLKIGHFRPACSEERISDGQEKATFSLSGSSRPKLYQSLPPYYSGIIDSFKAKTVAFLATLYIKL